MSNVYEFDTVNEAWWDSIKELNLKGVTQPGRDQTTKELLHAMYIVKDPIQRFVFSREINLAFAFAECIWILTGSNKVSELEFWNTRMKLYSDDGLYLHGAYGHRLINRIGNNQLLDATIALLNNPDRRDVVLQIWDRNLDLPNNEHPRSKDVPCNDFIHLLIRNNKLEFLVFARSNDIIWGVPYNFIQFTVLQEIMAGWLNLELGNHVRISDSLHVYERHWEYASNLEYKETVKNNDNLKLDYKNYEIVIAALNKIKQEIETSFNVEKVKEYLAGAEFMPLSYQNILVVLITEALHKYDEKELATNFLKEHCTNPAYVELQLAWMNRSK